MFIDPILRADTYKNSHFAQYRPGMQYISSYIESRGVQGHNWQVVVNAGMQYYLDQYMKKPFVTEKSLAKAVKRSKFVGSTFPTEKFQYILDKHGGYLPLRIQALPEGMVVPLRTPQVQVVNTDPECAFATSFIETALLRAIWYPSTVATLSFHIKKIIKQYMLRTAGHTDGIEFKLHDFGARGASSSETAQIGGFAHLLSFWGSDNVEALEMIEELYGEETAGFSVDAAEHSTITSFGGREYETQAYEHLLKQFGIANNIFSIVSDSYDFYNTVDNIYGVELKDKIVALGDIGSKLVVRPDSGDPATVVPDTIEMLMNRFGHTVNQKGFKVLPPYLGVIQGDGVNETSIRSILAVMELKGLSAENIVFGMGGALLQGVNRDTLKYAQKANEAQNINLFDGKPYPVFKAPKTDQGKGSKKGRQAVVLMPSNEITTVPEIYLGQEENLLRDVYLNGKILVNEDLATMRARVNEAL